MDFVATFIVFFAVIDPIGTVPVFIAVTWHFDEDSRTRIPLPAVQIAGGIVLFLFALTMIFGESKPDEAVRLVQDHHETAVFPLAVPSIASPGAMLAAVLLTEHNRYSVREQVQTVWMIFAVLLVNWVLMLMAGRVNRSTGSSGASVVSRIMGMILASVATANTLAGIKAYFGL